MMLTSAQLHAFQTGENSEVRSAISGSQYLWPYNVLMYQLDSTMSPRHKKVIRKTLRNLQKKLNLCVRFVQAKFGDRVIVTSYGSGCASNLGYLGGTQHLQLPWNCMSPRTIEHEFLHALGFHHTHSRSDRDLHITVIKDNIRDDKYYNFNKYTSSQTYGLPYDFDSVMHYGDEAWSKNGRKTIQAKDPANQGRIGRGQGVSPGDIEMVKRHYNNRYCAKAV